MVGNPPFLGDNKMLGGLGEEYIATLRRAYQGRVPGGADLVTYWFEKARAQIETEQAQRAGLVATNSIRRRGEPDSVGTHSGKWCESSMPGAMSLGLTKGRQCGFSGLLWRVKPRLSRLFWTESR